MTSQPDAPLFDVRNVTLAYGATVALRDTSLAVRPGEIRGLVGNHGEGKSSLCRVLAGLETPASGEIAGRDFSPRNTLTLETAAKLGIEFVDKTPRLLTALSVSDNIAMGECRKFAPFWHSPRASRNQVRNWLARFGIDFPVDLSLADIHPEEQNFVHILSRLYSRPRLLIIDETLEFIPSTLLAMSMEVLKKHVAEGMSLLWVTHHLDSVLKHADTVSVLRYGRILSTESVGGINKKELARRAYLDAFGESGHEGFYEFLKTTEAVLRDLPLAIVIVNRQGKLQYVNNEGEKLFPGGATAELGDEASLLFGEDNRELLDAVDRSARAGAMRGPSLFTLSGAKGKRVVSAQTCLVRDNGELVGVMLVVEDVSEQEGMRQKLMLEHNLSSIGMLAAGVAHEVNNPLEALRNYLRYLKKNPGTERAMDLFSEMQEEVGNIQKIIRNLMSFSGRTSENRKSVDLFAVCCELSSLINLEAETENIRLSCRGPEQPAAIHADVGEIRQILLNLIRNSMEAMPGGGEINIDVVADDERVWMVVRDNGGGIQFDALNDVFLPFSSTKAETGNNHGLGLSIVHNLVDKHNGVVSVNNLAIGCEFVLSFPKLA